MDKQITINHIMSRDIISARPTDTLEAVQLKLTKHKIHHIPVVENNQFVGLISQSDLYRMEHHLTVFSTDQSLEQNKAILPRDLAGMLPYMVHHDWLASYKEFDGFKRGMYRVSRMLRKGNILLDCISDVETHYEAFSSSFDEFFPQLIDHVLEQRTILSAR